MYFIIRKRNNVTPALCAMAVLASCSPPQIKDFFIVLGGVLAPYRKNFVTLHAESLNDSSLSFTIFD